MIVYDLDDFMILNVKGVDYRYFVCNISENSGDIQAHYECGFWSK